MRKKSRNWLLFVTFVITVAAIIAAPQYLTPRWSLTAVYLAITGFMIAVCTLITGNPWSLLLTQLNTMSLSRAQTILWTILVVGSYICLSFAHMSIVQIPGSVLGLIAVSVGSSVAASVVMSNKTGKDADPAEIAASQAKNGEGASASGTAFAWSDPHYASLADMLEGDELADAHTVDLAKVQMFFFTLAGAVVYAGMVYNSLTSAKPVTTLPDLPQQLIILMGMSHTGYLGGKMVNRTDEAAIAPSVQPPQPSAPAPVVTPAGPQPAAPGATTLPISQ
ncbi:MAG TPA: hypothetical protein VFN10_00275 [Thermoanaerobaculia bacterium]|nr:hypothetical protein [Thermoanaerobaculia bacterium]